MPARATVEETSPCPNLVTISTETESKTATKIHVHQGAAKTTIYQTFLSERRLSLDPR